MSTTSKKHANFISEPMGDKEVSEIAGIGPTYQKRLKEKGFEYVSKEFKILNNQYFQAYNLLGQFLLVNKDEEMFKEWLKEEISMTAKYQKDATECIAEWTRSYV